MSDLDVIRNLEAKLGIAVPELDDPRCGERGYTLNAAGNVTGLYLNSTIQMSDLASIGKLTTLTSLSLSKTRKGVTWLSSAS